jgi:hypothetical protein
MDGYSSVKGVPYYNMTAEEIKVMQIQQGNRLLRSLVAKMCANLKNGFEISDDAIFELNYTNNKLARLNP